jgi:enoyl-CoA hydratase
LTISPPLLVEDQGAIRTIRINRPSTRNAIDEELQLALLGAIRALEKSPNVRVAVLTGNGRAFSAGGDLGLIRRMQADTEVRDRTLEAGRELFDEFTSIGVPVIAAVNGPAVGAGCTLALLCDVVVISARAYLADPHAAIGLVPGDGGVVLWPQLAGLGRAKAYLLTGDRVSASEAWRLGLAHEVVPGNPVPAAVALAERMADRPAFAIRETKRALNLQLREGVSSFAYALEAERLSFDDAEHREQTP